MPRGLVKGVLLLSIFHMASSFQTLDYRSSLSTKVGIHNESPSRNCPSMVIGNRAILSFEIRPCKRDVHFARRGHVVGGKTTSITKLLALNKDRSINESAIATKEYDDLSRIAALDEVSISSRLLYHRISNVRCRTLVGARSTLWPRWNFSA